MSKSRSAASSAGELSFAGDSIESCEMSAILRGDDSLAVSMVLLPLYVWGVDIEGGVMVPGEVVGVVVGVVGNIVWRSGLQSEELNKKSFILCIH